jgi:hypothetical protein
MVFLTPEADHPIMRTGGDAPAGTRMASIMLRQILKNEPRLPITP